MNASRPNILICDPIHDDGVALLRQHTTVDIRPGLAREELEAIVDRYDALIVRSATKVPASVIEHGHKLRAIGRAGSGLDGIDVAAARARGIEVLNCPDANSLAVAEHTFALLLALARRVVMADASMKAGRWEKAQLLGAGLAGKALGIIGFGRIGRQVAKRAQAFGMRVLVNQPRFTPELALEYGVEHSDLPNLLREADFVTLHVPLRPETRGLLGPNELALMKPSAYLINTARGETLDEQALLAALDGGRLAGAALDVFTQEPVVDHTLTSHPKVIATPHIGASTEDAQRTAAMQIAEQLLALLRRQRAADTLAIRFVVLDQVVPHEAHDSQRVAKLASRIEADGRLSNPPVVVEWGKHYVVLDGATRVQALKQMGYQHVVVQVVSSNDAHLQANTWNHVISGESIAELLRVLHDVSGLQIIETAPEYLQDKMKNERALASLFTADKRGYLLQSAAHDSDSWLAVLNEIVARYIAWGAVDRTLVTDMTALKAQFPKAVALAAFPQFNLEQVLHLATEHKVVPAGITRFIIPGRVLRLHVPLDILRSDETLDSKNDWLDLLIQEKLVNRRLRYYQEPVILLDE
jgi:phosphoglycerate dehydrogenase-like enzyme